MPSRGHGNPRRGISVSSRWGWGPSTIAIMKSNGSIYVAVVLAVLAGYFTYQWWFNPSRAIKRQLGELAATLSVPEDSRSDMDRLARAARLRGFFAPDVHVTIAPGAPGLS